MVPNGCAVIPADFARELERALIAMTKERDDAVDRAEKAGSDDNDTRLNLNDALNECDTLRARISELEKDRERLHAVTCLLEERDSLRSAFEKLERSLDNEADVDDGKPNDAMRFLAELRATLAAMKGEAR
jgi:chromosome segregation ATPase